MGEILNAAMAGMFTFFVISLLAGAIYVGSTDPDKYEMTPYREYQNWSTLGEDNLTYSNTNNTVSNMQLQAEIIANKIADAQTQLSSGDITQQLLGAFGIISALTIDILFLLLAVMMDGVNLVGGIAYYMSALEAPWNMFAILGSLAIALFVVYMVFRLAAAIFKWDV